MDDDIEDLVKDLRNKDWKVRLEAAQKLGEVEDEKAVKVLINVLNDERWRVRKAAVNSLVKIGEPTVNPLIEALETEMDPAKREYAAKTLGLLGNFKAVETLIEALDDDNENVRDKAAEALGIIGDGRAVKPLEETLSDAHWFVRKSAAESLQQFEAYKNSSDD